MVADGISSLFASKIYSSITDESEYEGVHEKTKWKKLKTKSAFSDTIK